MQNKYRSAFTVIEVSLFLALSGFLMVGLIVGANMSISRQRYNDSINSFGEFLRGVYADVLNVSNDLDPNDNTLTYGPGRTPTVIYGKYISIGEAKSDSEAFDGTIYVYDLVGKAVNSTTTLSSGVLEALKSSEISINIADTSSCNNTSRCANKPYRLISYNVPWDATLEKTDGSLFYGGILVVRSPVTGGIRTYIYNHTTNPANYPSFHSLTDGRNVSSKFTNILNSSDTSERVLDLCLDSLDNGGPDRRDIRILKRANNSTGVVLVPMDDGDTVCQGRG